MVYDVYVDVSVRVKVMDRQADTVQLAIDQALDAIDDMLSILKNRTPLPVGIGFIDDGQQLRPVKAVEIQPDRDEDQWTVIALDGNNR